MPFSRMPGCPFLKIGAPRLEVRLMLSYVNVRNINMEMRNAYGIKCMGRDLGDWAHPEIMRMG